MTTLPSSSISVVIPVWNGASWVDSALAVLQRDRELIGEIVIVDDGSTDDGAVVLAAGAREFCPRVELLLQENRGPAAARNVGIQATQGDIIALLDIDDEWPEHSLQSRLAVFQATPTTQLVLGKVRVEREIDGEPSHSAPCVAFNFGAALYRHTVFETVGLLDENLRFGEDTDWFMRAREQQVPLHLLDDVTLIYRLHDSNMTRGKNMNELNVMRALKQSLDRRRQAGAAPQNLRHLPGMLTQNDAKKDTP